MHPDPEKSATPEARSERERATTLPKRPYKAPRLETHAPVQQIGVGYVSE
jgi:hypothetical protein